MYELFADDDVDIVLNITEAYNHYAVTKAALEAGKNVYSEKPLATTLEQGKELVRLAKEKGVRLGGAPIPSSAEESKPAAASSRTDTSAMFSAAAST